jgi:hypothetical protein
MMQKLGFYFTQDLGTITDFCGVPNRDRWYHRNYYAPLYVVLNNDDSFNSNLSESVIYYVQRRRR